MPSSHRPPMSGLRGRNRWEWRRDKVSGCVGDVTSRTGRDVSVRRAKSPLGAPCCSGQENPEGTLFHRQAVVEAKVITEALFTHPFFYSSPFAQLPLATPSEFSEPM